MLLEDVKDASAVTAVAERLGAELQRPFLFEERELFITVSIGIALTVSRGTTPEEILRNADLAMYHAKARGKARYELFDKSMNKPEHDRLGLELDLRHAISRGDFTLHYQPVLALDSGRITEVEALVRWNHPQRGLLLPGRLRRLDGGDGPHRAARAHGSSRKPAASSGSGRRRGKGRRS